MPRLLLSLAVFAAATSAAACNGSPAGPSPFTQTINGSIVSFNYLSHTFTTPRSGTMTVTLTWPAGNDRDLDLYLTGAECEDYYGIEPCTVFAESFSSEGTSESISRSVQENEAFKFWVDSFSFSNHSYSVQVTID